MVSNVKGATASIEALKKVLEPIEGTEELHVLVDNRTGARYCECHIRAEKLVALGTTDAPLDPDDQPEYRANRDLVENAPAFARMKDDALNRRSFSGIVAEFADGDPAGKSIKIIGGQHRFTAIEQAHLSGVNELHGVKVYIDLTMDQRFDAQLISNTVIAIGSDLFDRMHETRTGPELRDWCQSTGLLPSNEDFGDRRVRGENITVRAARTFITNYYAGTAIDPDKFNEVDTTPVLVPTGSDDQGWALVKKKDPGLWSDPKLKAAGAEFARMANAQRAAFTPRRPKTPVDFPEKASNFAVLASWAFVAGTLRSNEVRLKKHFALADTAGGDPLNASALAKGRHKTDPENYRGLGYRTDAKERGRMTELFFLQAEKGDGITGSLIDVAIKKYHAKQALLEVRLAEEKA